jgi:hypothetical protein
MNRFALGESFIKRIYYVQLQDCPRALLSSAGSRVLGLGAAPRKKLASLDDMIAGGTKVTGSASF